MIATLNYEFSSEFKSLYLTNDCGNGFHAKSQNIHGSIIFLILTVENKSCVFIFSYLFTGEYG